MWDVFVPEPAQISWSHVQLGDAFFVVCAVCVPDRPPIRGRSVSWGSTTDSPSSHLFQQGARVPVRKASHRSSRSATIRSTSTLVDSNRLRHHSINSEARCKSTVNESMLTSSLSSFWRINSSSSIAVWNVRFSLVICLLDLTKV